jgi:hypothetical protein
VMCIFSVLLLIHQNMLTYDYVTTINPQTKNFSNIFISNCLLIKWTCNLTNLTESSYELLYYANNDFVLHSVQPNTVICISILSYSQQILNFFWDLFFSGLHKVHPAYRMVTARWVGERL